MDNATVPSQKQFHEWMVTKALAAYLDKNSKEYPQRMKWLFRLEAETREGPRNIEKLCGFAWDKGEEVSGKHEETFKDNPDDRGNMPSAEFRKAYWGITPDFRYRTKGHQQLIIEAKGTLNPIGQKDRVQAARYFTYLRDTGYKGAIVYFAPNPRKWLDWLTEIGGQSGHPFGVVDWTTQVVPRIGNELLHVVAESLAQTADLLEIALRLSKTVPRDEF